jgi:hypothetical protein
MPDEAPDFIEEEIPEPTLAEGGEAAMAKLVEDAKTTPGVVFEEGTLQALAALAKYKFSVWVNLRARLRNKAHGVPITELNKRLRLNGDDGSGDDELPGRAISYDEVKPWDEPVDGAELLTELAGAIGGYVIMDAYQRDAVALWGVFTHTHDLRDYAPLLVITSPMKRCGKSRLEEVLARVVPRPEPLIGVSGALLPRLIENHHPTLLIDEFDAMMKGDKDMAEALRGVLNSSFNRAGATVCKLVQVPGGGWQERRFSLWAPAAIGGIGGAGGPPDTVKDRAVNIRLMRKLVGQKVKRLRGKDGGELTVLRRKIARWVANNEVRLRATEPKELAGLNDRQQDAWEPLFAIAEVAGGDWLRRARAAATALCGVDEAEAYEGDIKLLLLADVHDIFTTKFPKEHPSHKAGPGRPDEGPRLTTKQLLERLCAIEERTWSVWGTAKRPMTDMGLAGLLKPCGIRSTTIRTETGAVAKGYYLHSFEDAFARYLSAPGVSSRYDVTNRGNQGEIDNSQTLQTPICNEGQIAQKPSNSGICNVVTAENEGEREGGGSEDVSEVDLIDAIVAYAGGRDRVIAPPNALIAAIGLSLDEDEAIMVDRLMMLEDTLAKRGIAIAIEGGYVVLTSLVRTGTRL